MVLLAVHFSVKHKRYHNTHTNKYVTVCGAAQNRFLHMKKKLVTIIISVLTALSNTNAANQAASDVLANSGIDTY